MLKRITVLFTSLASLLVAAALFAGEAGAVERVQDGGFEQSSCPTGANRCTSAAWTQFRSVVNAFALGPICGPETSGCAGGGSGYTTEPNWARLGSAVGPGPSGGVDSRIDQMVSIPAAPATLRFNLRILDLDSRTTGHMEVSLDGRVVWQGTADMPGYTNSQRVTVDVSSLAGATRLLRLEGNNPFSTESDSFDIDDVSLDAPPASTSTGQRAAALKKCKKKRSKKARKKCRSRAQKLPI
jgi:hypothetical protein